MSKVVPPMVFIISGVGTSGTGKVLPPSATSRGMVLPSLLVLSLPAGAGGDAVANHCVEVVGHRLSPFVVIKVDLAAT